MIRCPVAHGDRNLESCLTFPFLPSQIPFMKLSSLPGLIVAALLLISTADAPAKGKPKKKPAPAAPAAPAAPDYSKPAEALAPYIANLEQLLALHRQAPPPVMARLEKASGDLVIARLEFATLRKTAEPAEQPKLDGAIATCDALTRSLEERQKVLGDLQASSAVKGSGALNGGPRKDNLTQGIKGGDLAKAVGGTLEYKREKNAKGAAKKSAAQTDDAMTAGTVNRWNKRSIELRKFITDAYAHTK